jgi:stage II sporulation protein D
VSRLLLAALAAALGQASAAQQPGALPPPLPPPLAAEALASPADPVPGDPLEVLWGHRIDFSGGAPVVTIRIAEGRDAIPVSPRAAARLEPRGGAPVRVPAGIRLQARVRGAVPARLAWRPLLAQFDARDRAGLERARAAWEARGVVTATRTAGGVYGIAGHVIDNRRNLLVAAGDFTELSAGAFTVDAWRRLGERPEPMAELVSRPAGTVEVVGPAGEILASGDRVVTIDAPGEGIAVDDRGYRGRLHLTVDAAGRVAAVLALPLEELLRGLVPSEMPAGAPQEALRAQAVTARSNVLAQIGTRHLADPWALCSDVHCQAYRGEAAQVASTDAAVRATAGQALFGAADGRLVDGVYSAMCGGHGEDNDAVWGGTPSRSLRGRPDLAGDDAAAWAGGLADASRVAAFLAAAPESWCSRAPGARADRYRWERRVPAADLDALAATLGLGAVDALSVESRGVSGRVTALRVDGERGTTTVHGELRIRRLLGNLPSAMFVLSRDGADWIFRGGGWGHGAGMCQWGAIGRAAAGHDYRRILRAYFSDAEVARIY